MAMDITKRPAMDMFRMRINLQIVPKVKRCAMTGIGKSHQGQAVAKDTVNDLIFSHVMLSKRKVHLSVVMMTWVTTPRKLAGTLRLVLRYDILSSIMALRNQLSLRLLLLPKIADGGCPCPDGEVKCGADPDWGYAGSW
jgi:hypothetical protein